MTGDDLSGQLFGDVGSLSQPFLAPPFPCRRSRGQLRRPAALPNAAPTKTKSSAVAALPEDTPLLTDQCQKAADCSKHLACLSDLYLG